MRVAVRAVVLVAAVAGLAVEVWAVRAGWSWVAAALDLLAGWSLLAPAGWAMHVTAGCRALFGLSGAFWFLATPQVVGGWAGHDAALLGGAWLAPLATALLGAPGAWPQRRFPRAVAAASWIRALPVLAAIGWLTAAVGGCLAAAALAGSAAMPSGCRERPPLSWVWWSACPACWRRWPAAAPRWNRWSPSAWPAAASPFSRSARSGPRPAAVSRGWSSSWAGRPMRARWSGASRTRWATRGFACCTSWHRGCRTCTRQERPPRARRPAGSSP